MGADSLLACMAKAVVAFLIGSLRLHVSLQLFACGLFVFFPNRVSRFSNAWTAKFESDDLSKNCFVAFRPFAGIGSISGTLLDPICDPDQRYGKRSKDYQMPPWALCCPLAHLGARSGILRSVR